MSASTQVETGTIPVVEVFGPTVQGEGMLAGLPTHFLRLGLCDYRCEWCDSMYAVEPRLVREHADRLTDREIVDRLTALDKGPQWITISGGNPAIHDLTDLVAMLKAAGWHLSVETQGSIWQDWLGSIDALTISPKPPSSGMVTTRHTAQTREFLDKAEMRIRAERRSLKIVVFDETDYQWARNLLASRGTLRWDCYLSVGTTPPRPGETVSETRTAICDRYDWLASKVAADVAMQRVRVFPQLHALAWGHARGV